MSCGLSVLGENFDVDAFVSKVNTLSFTVAYKGDSINKVNQKKRTHSIASITTSEAGFDDVPRQINETIAFLTKHKEALKHIAGTPGIDYATINFGVDSIIDRKHISQSFYFTIDLIKICAELGIEIELSIYKPDMEVILENNRLKNLNDPSN